MCQILFQSPFFLSRSPSKRACGSFRPLGQIPPMKAPSQPQTYWQSWDWEIWEKPETRFLWRFKTLNCKMFWLSPCPKPAPADTFNSNSSGGLGWWKSQALWRRAHYSLSLPKTNPQFPCRPTVILMMWKWEAVLTLNEHATYCREILFCAHQQFLPGSEVKYNSPGKNFCFHIKYNQLSDPGIGGDDTKLRRE